MRFFLNISIKNKIISTILFVSTITMLIGFTIVGISDVNNLRKDMYLNTLMNTKLIGEYSIAPLTFDDNTGAKSVLSKLSTLPEIVSGTLYDRNGVFFSSYKRSENVLIPALYEKPDHLTESKSNFTKTSLIIEHPIIYNNFKYGIIVITIDIALLKTKIQNYIYIILIILIGMIIFSYFLANRFQKPISGPILELAKLTRKISGEGDYSVQIQRKSNDEIGILYDDFNNMLKQILNREEARDIAEKKLLKAKEKAEESDHLKSAFLANMSHEIRTPMNAILGFTELLAMPDSDISQEEKLNFIKLINNSGNNLLQLIDDIIDISKIEANQLKIIHKNCALNSTLKDILESFIELKKQKEKDKLEIRLNKLAKEQSITIKTDPLRLNQILINLISNALKFTETGFIEIGYEIIKEQELLFYVKDTGLGMEQDKKDLVFERFTKIENDSTRLFRGAGLGLAISRSLVELLGGKIWVESTPQIGSTFYFTIPFNKVETITNRSQLTFTSSKYDWKGKTILIVEDEPANYTYIKEVLKKTNVNILKAINGIEAIEIVEQNKNIDIIIMDIKMPEMDGYEATRRIKKINEDIPIISQSAYAMPSDIDKGLKSGMSDYLVKPVKPTVLLAIINKQFEDSDAK